jgi:hypothetical protein
VTACLGRFRFLTGAKSVRVATGSMVGGADRVRRPAGPPLTRWPRPGQLGGEEDGFFGCSGAARRCAALICVPAGWPGVRRASVLSNAEPGADAGPAAPQRAALTNYG